MKYLIMTVLGLMFALLAHSQNTEFEQKLAGAVAQLHTAEASRDYEAAAAQFTALQAAAPETAWLPAYYTAYCHLQLAVAAMDRGETEALARSLDRAQAALDKAKAVAGAESEVTALQGYIYTGRIWESPMMNGMRYGSSCVELYSKAIAQNPDNPRAHHLMGMHLFFTPRFFGGGAKKALPYLEKAEALYAAVHTAQSALPDWGQYFNQQLLRQAKAELER